jgi:hypothetical protein
MFECSRRELTVDVSPRADHVEPVGGTVDSTTSTIHIGW